MNKDTIKGTAKKAEGSIEKVYGKVIDNKATQYKGEMRKAEGEAQKQFGKAKDAIKDAADDAE